MARKVEGSLWRCTVLVPDQYGQHSCDETLEQSALEDHLRIQHALKVERPSDVVEWFCLVQGSGHGRAPRQGKREDQTLEMFGKDEFR